MAPVRAEGERRFPVHQQRPRPRQPMAQWIEHRKAVRVAIAPVVDRTLGQPARLAEAVEPTACAKDDKVTLNWQECQEIHLAFGDQDA